MRVDVEGRERVREELRVGAGDRGALDDVDGRGLLLLEPHDGHGRVLETERPPASWQELVLQERDAIAPSLGEGGDGAFELGFPHGHQDEGRVQGRVGRAFARDGDDRDAGLQEPVREGAAHLPESDDDGGFVAHGAGMSPCAHEEQSSEGSGEGACVGSSGFAA